MSMRQIMKLKKRTRTKLTVVEGDLKIGKGATIIAEKDTIVVNGKIKNKNNSNNRKAPFQSSLVSISLLSLGWQRFNTFLRSVISTLV